MLAQKSGRQTLVSRKQLHTGGGIAVFSIGRVVFNAPFNFCKLQRQPFLIGIH